MKIHDISQEVFGCAVYPGDPQPERFEILKKSRGDICNLTAVKMCAHNGTHVDAPYHFLEEGKTIEQIDLKRLAGYAYVTFHDGMITAKDAENILAKAAEAGRKAGKEDECPDRRILVGGKATVSEEAARVFAEKRLLLIGNESQTVGPEDAPMAVHLILLGAEVILLEGIRLNGIREGIYLLNAVPLNLGGADGAPCRAILIEE